MKAFKVKIKDVVSATNIIEDHVILSDNLFQTASNYWLITGRDDIVVTEITRYFGILGVNFEIDDVEGE